jgi:hypothetical protein
MLLRLWKIGKTTNRPMMINMCIICKIRNRINDGNNPNPLTEVILKFIFSD